MYIKKWFNVGISGEKENDVKSEKETYFNFNMKRDIHVTGFKKSKKMLCRDWEKQV